MCRRPLPLPTHAVHTIGTSVNVHAMVEIPTLSDDELDELMRLQGHVGVVLKEIRNAIERQDAVGYRDLREALTLDEVRINELLPPVDVRSSDRLQRRFCATWRRASGVIRGSPPWVRHRSRKVVVRAEGS